MMPRPCRREVRLPFTKHQGPPSDAPNEPLPSTHRPAYIVYLVMMGVVVFGTYVLYLHSKKVCR